VALAAQWTSPFARRLYPAYSGHVTLRRRWYQTYGPTQLLTHVAGVRYHLRIGGEPTETSLNQSQPCMRARTWNGLKIDRTETRAFSKHWR